MSSREEEVSAQVSLTIQEWEDLADICQYWRTHSSTRFYQPRHDRTALYVEGVCGSVVVEASGG